MSKIEIKDITDKNEIEVIDLYAKRENIYVKYVDGVFRKLRAYSSFIMLALFFGIPWVKIGENPLVLFNLEARQFHIFGHVFWPQDFMLLSWLLIILAFTLFFVTVFAGRLWCGYACPQFVWTWIFIRVEQIVEGDRNARIKMDKDTMSVSKFSKKSIKHFVWLLIAIISAITFTSYFTPIRELLSEIYNFSLGPWQLWWLGFFTISTYGAAGFLREQVCIYMCPYARFQSVMFDKDTLIISYDEKRGENRGKRKKDADYKSEGLGDCIDCNQCVQVCPVGIDIRDGLQYECVSCGACIDACDNVMDKMGYDKGLVRYTTERELEGEKSKILRPRLIGYFVALMIMVSAFSYVLLTRIPLEVDVIRERGQLYSISPSGDVRNAYTIKIANKSTEDAVYTISVDGLKKYNLLGNTVITAKPNELLEQTVIIEVNPNDMDKTNYEITFYVTLNVDDKVKEKMDTMADSPSRFIGPSR